MRGPVAIAGEVITRGCYHENKNVFLQTGLLESLKVGFCLFEMGE